VIVALLKCPITEMFLQLLKHEVNVFKILNGFGCPVSAVLNYGRVSGYQKFGIITYFLHQG
jgi:hypothetical protein